MASTFPTKVKDPNAVLDYVWDWAPLSNGTPGAESDWLAAGETITARTVTAPAGITKDSDSFSNTTVTAWLSGGTAGSDYDVVCHITTSAGRQDDRTVTIQCRQR